MLSSSFTILTTLHIIATLLSGGLVCYAVYHIKVPKTQWFIFLSIVAFMYIFGYLLETLSPTLDSAYLAYRVQYIGIAFLGPLFYLSSKEYFRQPTHHPVFVFLLLVPLPLMVLILANSWPSSTLFYTNLHFSQVPIPHLEVTPGPLYVIRLFSNCLFINLGLTVILHQIYASNKEAKTKAIPLLLASLLPITALLFSHIFKTPLDFIPLSLAVALFIMALSIQHSPLNNWQTLAREGVLEEISDAFILLDNNNCFLDANTKALQYFPDMHHISLGAPIQSIKDFPAFLLDSRSSQKEFSLVQKDKTLHLRASRSPLTHGGQKAGHCIMLYDHSQIHHLVKELQNLATHDSLTSLYNRTTFFRLANHDLELALRNGTPVCVMMLDIDFFKQVNDTYGHQCGDAVLAQTAKMLTSRLRKTDIIGRYGGEEFSIHLPNTQLDQAIRIAESLRKSIENAVFHSNKNEALTITVSIGIASLEHQRHKSPEALINDADIALYQAKTSGRNKVVVAEITENEEDEEDEQFILQNLPES